MLQKAIQYFVYRFRRLLGMHNHTDNYSIGIKHVVHNIWGYSKMMDSIF